MKKMRNAYDQSTKLHAVMEITVYESDTAKVPYYFEKAEIFRDQSIYRYTLTEREMLLTNSRFIMVNKSTNEISVSARDTKNEQLIKQQMSFDLDSILSLYKNPEYLGKEGQLNHYKLYQESDLINRIDLFLTQPESLLKKLHYYYLNGQFVTIEFKVLDLKPVIPRGVFSEDKYIVLTNGKYQGVGEYKTYNVYEQ